MADLTTLYQHFLSHRNISTDTRNITPGCLFFALKGENFDANTFAQQALDRGAAYVIVDNADYQLSEQCILVRDVLITLQDLARHHRTQLNIPVLGLTGSNGKTTTKELIKAVLSQHFKCFATKGNLNNHIGVPLSILSITDNIEIAVIEMGANHRKEIAFLCGIAQPTQGLITNVGMAHLDGFGGFEGVKKGKAELYAHLKATGGTAFIYRNNPYLLEMSAAADLNEVIYYGSDPTDTISGKLLASDPFLSLNWSHRSETYQVTTNLTGAYNFENILAAVCIGNHFKLSADQINRGLSEYVPKNNRSQITKTEKNTIICDYYNANPSSMAAAIHNLNTLTASNKVAILGDMFELGNESDQQHTEVISLAAKTGTPSIFIGKHFKKVKGQFPGHFFETVAEAQEYLKQQTMRDTLVLLKGSRGMALEQLMPLL